MAAPSSFYVYDGKENVILGKWKVKSGSQLLPRTVIFTYRPHSDEEKKDNDDKNVMKLESSLGGTVQELLVKEGEIVKPGTAIMKIESCRHEVIMKDLCAICGADLRILSTTNLQEVFASRSFSMVHVVPELKCNLKQAEQLDQADEVRLLTSRKLVLLVDLDQTLIHTTNDDIPPDLADVHHFQLYGSRSAWYHTRLRPHTQDFLEKIAKYYELHIFTFGARLYAHKIASILDPDRALFSHRILSRDECFDATSKTGNLKALFPRGDAMVCIIDDREDVWNFAPNVIHVKPYIFFNNTGDINNPNFLRGPVYSPKKMSQSSATQSQNSCEQNSPEESSIKEADKNEDNESANPVSETSETVPSTEKCIVLDCDSEVSDDCVEELEVTKVKELFEDDDDYLLYLEEILLRIHGAYFDLYDEMCSQNDTTKSKVPDLKNVIPYVRRKVLRGVNLVFSGVIPTNIAPEKNSLWALAKSLGAEVFHDLIMHDRRLKTTHVVASKAGTAKISRAKRSGDIHIVTPSWLICCATRWERVDERLFPLKKSDNTSALLAPLHNTAAKGKFKSYSAKKGKSRMRKHDEKQNNSKKHDNGEHSDVKILEPVLDFSPEELDNMDREVAEACTSTEDESDENGESLSRGLKRKRSGETVKLSCDENPIPDKVELPQYRNDSNIIDRNSFIQRGAAINGDGDPEIFSSDSDSVAIVSSGEEELVAEMEREIFGEQSSS